MMLLIWLIPAFSILLGASFTSVSDSISSDFSFSFSDDDADEAPSAPKTILLNGQICTLLERLDEIRTWNSCLNSGLAAIHKCLMQDPAIAYFTRSPASRYKELSMFHSAPFKYDDIMCDSVESAAVANVYNHIPDDDVRKGYQKPGIITKIALMDGISARAIARCNNISIAKYNLKMILESKLAAKPSLLNLIKRLVLEESKILISLDMTPLDRTGEDQKWGMVRCGDYYVGMNWLGKFYHEIVTNHRVS